MNKYSIYIALGVLAVIYVIIKMGGGNRKKGRKSRKFMDGKRKRE